MTFSVDSQTLTDTHSHTQLRLKDIKNHIKIYRYTFHDILIDANINEI